MAEQLDVEMIVKAIAEGFDEVKDSLKESGDAAEDAGEKAEKSESGWTTLNNAMGAAQKVAQMVGKAFDATVGSFVDAAAGVRQLSRAIGSTPEEASRLIQAADDVGISVESMQGAMETAIRKGVNPTIANIGRLADQYNAIQDPIERTKFLMDNFGRAGADLGALMEKGSIGMKKAGDEAERLGLILSDKDLKAARKFEEGVDNLNDKMQGITQTIGKVLVPVLNDAADGFGFVTDAMLPATDTETKLRAAITNTAIVLGTESETVKQLSAELLKYLQQQKEVTDHLNSVGADAIWGVNGALDETTRATRRTTEATKTLSGATAEETKAVQEHAAAIDAMAASSTNAAIAQGNLAATLKDATPIDIAKQAISQLEEAMKSGVNPGIDYAGMIQDIQIKNGIASLSSVAMADGLLILNDQLVSGAISSEQYQAALIKLPAAAKDGAVSFSEFGIALVADHKTKIDRMDEVGNAQIERSATTPMQKMKDTAQAATAQIDLIGVAWRSVPIEITTNHRINTIYTTEGTPPPVTTQQPDTNNRMVGDRPGISANTSKTYILNYNGTAPGNVVQDFGMLESLQGGL